MDIFRIVLTNDQAEAVKRIAARRKVPISTVMDELRQKVAESITKAEEE
jgi:hypothetical protein